VLLTNRGLIFGGGDRYRLLCNEALGYSSTEEPGAALVPDGSLLVATSGGLLRTPDEGCSVQGVEPFARTNTTSLAQDPEDRARIYLASYDATGGGIHVSTDGGATFTRTHEAPETQFLEELLVAPGEPSIVYASGFDFSLTGPEREHFVLRSDDQGMSFERIAVTLADNEADLTLLSIAPSDPDTLLARALDNTQLTRLDRLLVSRDGGRSWQSPLTVHQLFSAGFTAGAVWVTGIDGLYRSGDDAASFAQVEGPTTMSGILELHGDALVCGRFAPGKNGLARVMEGSDALTPWFEFDAVTEPVACAEGTETAVACETLWRDWENEILRGLGDGGVAMPTVDAGAMLDTGTHVDASTEPAAPRERASSGCAIAKNANAHAAWTAWALALLAYLTCRCTRSRRAPAHRTAGCRAARASDTRA
jgi:hypothetical protein